MTKKKLKDVADLIKDRKELKKFNSALGRLADPKVQPGIDYAMRRFSELAPPGVIKRELQLSGLSTNQSDIALEAARYLLTLDENWTEEIVMAVRLGVSQTLSQLTEMNDRAENDKERREIMSMKLKAYEAIRKLLPEKVDLTIEEKESVENVIFEVYDVNEE